MYKLGVRGMFVEFRNLDGDISNGVGAVWVIDHVDKDGKLELKIKTKLNQIIRLL